MGGLLQEDETLDQAAKRILVKLTGMTDVYLEELKVFSDVARDPVERTISVTYFALINIHNYEHQITHEYEARWFPISRLPGLLFDKRNFRRMILASGLLIKLWEKDRSGSKKGAYFYQLDEERYREKFTSILNLTPNSKELIG